MFTPYLRHVYTVAQGDAPITATGLRIKVSDGTIDIDEIEVNPNSALQALADGLIVLTPEPAYSLKWDGNDGEFFSPSVGARAPLNDALAGNGSTAFGSGQLFANGGIHDIDNVIDILVRLGLLLREALAALAARDDAAGFQFLVDAPAGGFFDGGGAAHGPAGAVAGGAERLLHADDEFERINGIETEAAGTKERKIVRDFFRGRLQHQVLDQHFFDLAAQIGFGHGDFEDAMLRRKAPRCHRLKIS
jgi:hypothetical protein